MSKKYFIRVATCMGLENFAESNLKGIENLYIVKGKSKFLKSYILKRIARFTEEMGKNIECAISPFDISCYDAVILRDIKTAFVDEELLTEKKRAKVVDTNKFLSNRHLQKYKDSLIDLEKKAKECMEGYYSAYATGKIIHDEWEKLYIKNIDFDRLNKYEEGLLESLIQNKSTELGTQNFERFFGCSTQDGSVNYVENITENLKNRYFIKGRPGTGKSTFMKKLWKRAEEMGYNTEVYYCSFDPKSLDMVLVPELSFCVFDSTAPHEFFPEKDGDSILDFYNEAGLGGVDEKYALEFERIKKLYSFKVNEGIGYLRLSCGYEREKEYYYESFANLELVDKTVDRLVRKLT